MATVDMVMPKMGESIMEATILKWHKKPGDAVRIDETILEIATDKVDSEVPSIEEGVVEQLLFQENDVVPVGAVIARIKIDAAESISNASFHHEDEKEELQKLVEANISSFSTPSYTAPKTEEPVATTNRFYSPLVLNIASQEGVSLSELEGIPGTGNEGRVTKKDILDFVNKKRSARPGGNSQMTVHRAEQQEKAEEIKELPTANHQLQTTGSGNVEIIEMDRMRRLIADHMVRSKLTSPHVTSFAEADVTNMVLWREKVKKDFEKREGTKITFTPLFVEAIVRCIKKFPLINSSVDENRIIIKKDINIGMAAALPNGNLIVPVIKNADQLNLVGLAKQVNGMAENARNNKLRPEDTQGGSFTFTNVGTFGSLMGTPIINQPQVAILAVGMIKKRPVVIETPHGDSIAIRHMMYLSMSYDHRIIDGSLGATFLTAVANELENFQIDREV